VPDAERIRLEIAFEGGQALSVSVTSAVADALGTALAGGPGAAFAFEAEDGQYTVAVQKIVFVKRYARDSRVGFGARG
jgi:hypothetical protein